MKTLAEGWLEEGLAKGKEEGLQQGLQEGLQQGLQQGRSEAVSSQRRTILRILQRRFQLSNDDVVRFAEQLARINDLEQLAQLIDHALDVVVLTDFHTKLKQYLP
jgi:flagellar biosynthesis/type III secretory pathway protein FliH